MAERIKKGDFVSVNFNNVMFTLTKRAKVLYVPCQPGDSWIFEDSHTGDIHYVSEGCTVTITQEGE